MGGLGWKQNNVEPRDTQNRRQRVRTRQISRATPGPNQNKFCGFRDGARDKTLGACWCVRQVPEMRDKVGVQPLAGGLQSNQSVTTGTNSLNVT